MIEKEPEPEFTQVCLTPKPEEPSNEGHSIQCCPEGQWEKQRMSPRMRDRDQRPPTLSQRALPQLPFVPTPLKGRKIPRGWSPERPVPQLHLCSSDFSERSDVPRVHTPVKLPLPQETEPSLSIRQPGAAMLRDITLCQHLSSPKNDTDCVTSVVLTVSHHLGTCYKHTPSGPTPDLLNQKLGEGGPAFCALPFPGNSDAH